MKQDKYLQHWNAIVKSDDLASSLQNHFAYLADSPKFEQVLPLVFGEATNVEIVDNELLVTFSNGEILKASQPAKSQSELYPKSLVDKFKVHESLYLQDSMINLEDHGLFHEDDWAEVLEEEDSELVEICEGDLSHVLSPMSDYSDLWIYHPIEKNKQGEPVLYFLSHEGGDIADAVDFNIGSLFLYRLAQSLELEIEKLVEQDPSVEELDDATVWWNGLGENWKAFFNEKYSCDSSSKKISKLWKEHTIVLEDDFEAEDLKPLFAFKKLHNLSFGGGNSTSRMINPSNTPKTKRDALKSYSSLSGLKNLSTLNLSDVNIEDVSVISSLNKLVKLDLSNTNVSDLSPISDLVKLTTLHINDTPVKSLAPLAKLNKLWYLYMDGVHFDNLEVFTHLKNLRWLNISRSNLNDFSQLLGAKELSTIYVKDVPASLESCLEYINQIMLDPPMGFSMDCDFDSPFKLLPQMQQLKQDQRANTEPLMSFIYSCLGWYHNKEYQKVVLEVLQELLRLDLAEVSKQRQQYTLKRLIYFLREAAVQDQEFLDQLFALMASMADEISSMSIEIAMFYAQHKNKQKTLEYIKKALSSGYLTFKIKKEKAFDFLLNDADFEKLLTKE